MIRPFVRGAVAMSGMSSGEIELRSGVWRWGVRARADGGGRWVWFRSEAGGEMEARVEGDGEVTAVEATELATRADVRRFVDERGVEWTAELKRSRVRLGGAGAESPMVLFWCVDRACLATLAPTRSLGELTTDELRAQLRMCLSG